MICVIILETSDDLYLFLFLFIIDISSICVSAYIYYDAECMLKDTESLGDLKYNLKSI